MKLNQFAQMELRLLSHKKVTRIKTLRNKKVAKIKPKRKREVISLHVLMVRNLLVLMDLSSPKRLSV